MIFLQVRTKFVFNAKQLIKYDQHFFVFYLNYMKISENTQSRENRVQKDLQLN